MPELHSNLLSVLHFTKRSSEMHFVGEGCSILDQCKIVACKGNLCGNLYVMRITMLPISELAHIAVLDSFPTEGKDPSEAVLIADNLGSKASMLRAKDPKVQCARVCIMAAGLVLQGIAGSERWPLDALV